MTIIDIYPPCDKPDWVYKGAKVYVWGEAFEVFTVDLVLSDRVVLINEKGFCHGAESFTKLHQYPNS